MDFFKSGLITARLTSGGTTDVVRDAFMIVVISGTSSDEHCFSSNGELKERGDKGEKLGQKRGETGSPRTTSKRKASRTADIPITGAAKQRPIQHRVESERNINVNNKSVQCKYVLKCYMFNARSVINKIDYLSVFMYENDPDVDTLDSELCMTGYELYRFDRRHRRVGGCIIYAKNDLNVVKIDIDIFYTESIWCKIVARKEEVVIGVLQQSVI